MKISPEVIAVLESAEVDGTMLRLVGQLDRKLYLAVNAVLDAIGGAWNKKLKAHVFDEDAAQLIDQILLTGEYRRTKQEFGQFDSPPAVVERVLALAGIEPGMMVLEPSAGIGNLAVEAIKAGARVMTNEIDPRRCAALVMRITALGKQEAWPAVAWCEGAMRNFLTMPPERIYDRVVMNPPFAGQADIEHVRHAALFLKPGGRLVSVMSAGTRFRTNKRTVEFREFVQELAGRFEDLPDEAFAESGTKVSSCIVTLDTLS